MKRETWDANKENQKKTIEETVIHQSGGVMTGEVGQSFEKLFVSLVPVQKGNYLYWYSLIAP